MHITKAKKDIIRRHYIAGGVNVKHLAEQLELRHSAIRFYIILGLTRETLSRVRKQTTRKGPVDAQHR